MTDWNAPYYETYNGKNLTLYQDSYVVPALSATTLVTHTILTMAVIGCVLARRKYQQIRVRNFVLMILNVAAWWLLSMPMILRLAIGRWRFPCFFYSVNFAFTIPLVFIPMVLRLWRLFFVNRLQSVKQTIAKVLKNVTASTMPMENEEENIKRANTALKRQHRVLAFWISPIFFVVCYVIGLLVAVPFWLLAVFIGPMDAFGPFLNGCYTNLTVTIILGSQVIIYAIIGAILVLLLCIYKVRDQWYLRAEAICTIVLHLIILGCYVLVASLYWPISFFHEAERHVPAGYILIASTFCDPIITCLLPVIGSCFGGKKSDNKIEVDLERVLEHEALLKLFKQYCVESFCSEVCLCIIA